MGTKRKTYDYDIPTIFFHCVGGGSCIALLLGYFLLDKNVNTGMKFFLYWTCASILAFTAGFYLRTISGISGWGFFSIIFASSEIFAGLVIQGLAMTYLFVTYQPGPDQISQIYAFSWILVIAVIHALWALEDGTDQGVVWNPFYEAIGKSLGIDSGNLSILMFKLSVFITIGLWATIAALIGNGGGNVMEAYSAAGKTWFGWWLVEHYFSYHIDCPDGCVSGEPARGRKDPPYFQMSYGSLDNIPDLVDPLVESPLPVQ